MIHSFPSQGIPILDESMDDQTDQQSPKSFDNDGSYVCNSCGEEIVIPLDPAAGQTQNYVEDCPVCCNPSVIHVHWDGAEARVWAESEQDRF